MNRNIIIGIVVAVAVVILASVFIFKKGPLSQSGVNQKVINVPAASQTRQVVPSNVVVPDQGAKNVPQNVAVPSTVAPSNPNNNSKFRDFTLTFNNNTVTPDTIIGNLGDTVRLTVKAVDRDYDFTQPDFGFRVPIPKGTSKSISFDLTAAGKFTFYCNVCGGLNKGATGYIVIAAPK